jgi:hypothetical protein
MIRRRAGPEQQIQRAVCQHLRMRGAPGFACGHAAGVRRYPFDRAAVVATAIGQIFATVLTPEKRQELEDCLRNRDAEVQRQAIDVGTAAVDTATEIEQILATQLTLEQWQELKDYLRDEFADVQRQNIAERERFDE